MSSSVIAASVTSDATTTRWMLINQVTAGHGEKWSDSISIEDWSERRILTDTGNVSLCVSV